ncbi:hypothetical protein [Microbacterium sp. NPDC055683]
MTLIAEGPAHVATRPTAPLRSAHPSLGRAPEATLIPVSLTCYQVALGDSVKGYICVQGPGWECFAGSHMADAVSIGFRATLTVAIRDLVADSPAA